MHTYEVRPRKDHRGVHLISDALPLGRLWVWRAIEICFAREVGLSLSAKTMVILGVSASFTVGYGLMINQVDRQSETVAK